MQTATVKWFNVAKGFGFATLESGDDVFLHAREVIDYHTGDVRDGDRFECEVTDTPKGPRAVRVRML